MPRPNKHIDTTALRMRLNLTLVATGDDAVDEARFTRALEQIGDAIAKLNTEMGAENKVEGIEIENLDF